MFKDYYNILHVPFTASAEQIRTSFKKLALLHHPDRTIHNSRITFSKTEPLETSKSKQTEEVCYAQCTPSASEQNAIERNFISEENDYNKQTADNTITTRTHESKSDEDAKWDENLEFTDIVEAYEVLSDVARRYLYDLNYFELREVCHRARQREKLQAQLVLAAKKINEQLINRKRSHLQELQEKEELLREQQQWKHTHMEQTEEKTQQHEMNKCAQRNECRERLCFLSRSIPAESVTNLTKPAAENETNTTNSKKVENIINESGEEVVNIVSPTHATENNLSRTGKLQYQSSRLNKVYKEDENNNDITNNNSYEDDDAIVAVCIDDDDDDDDGRNVNKCMETSRLLTQNLTESTETKANDNWAYLQKANMHDKETDIFIKSSVNGKGKNKNKELKDDLSTTLPILVVRKKMLSIPLTSKTFCLSRHAIGNSDKGESEADMIAAMNYASQNNFAAAHVTSNKSNNKSSLSLPTLKQAKSSKWMHYATNLQRKHRRAIQNTVRVFFARELGLNNLVEESRKVL